jgi:DNA polymerase-3 subunit gamma/tau
MSNFFSIEEIQGQETALQYIRHYVKAPHMIPPLLVFYGPSSVGKWALAERFSRHVLCLHGTGCGLCQSCKSFINNQHPDYIVFPANQRIAIGDDKDPAEFTVRWLQNRRLNYRPHLSKYRIILFPDASLINNEAESALLKSLEEPPAHSRFIFIVDDLTKLKQTIISRAICIPFSYLNKQVLQSLSSDLELFREDFFGGSLIPYDIPSEVITLTREMVSKNLRDSILLLQLENWIREYKDDHPEWTEDFDYTEFLELVSTIMIYEFCKENIEDNATQIEMLYDFKRQLHKNIPGLEHFLLSELFHKFTRE